MKRIILLMAFCVACPSAWAQSAEDTLAWLNAKKASIYDVRSLTVSRGTLVLTDDSIRAAHDDGSFTHYPWRRIKDVQTPYDYIRIVFDEDFNGKAAYISMRVSGSREELPRVAAAFKHMAELKGATLVNDELF